MKKNKKFNTQNEQVEHNRVLDFLSQMMDSHSMIMTYDPLSQESRNDILDAVKKLEPFKPIDLIGDRDKIIGNFIELFGKFIQNLLEKIEEVIKIHQLYEEGRDNLNVLKKSETEYKNAFNENKEKQILKIKKDIDSLNDKKRNLNLDIHALSNSEDDGLHWEESVKCSSYYVWRSCTDVSYSGMGYKKVKWTGEDKAKLVNSNLGESLVD